MTNQLAKKISLGIVGAVLLAATPVFANHHDTDGNCSGMFSPKHTCLLVADKVKDFNLTADQKSQIKALREANQAKVEKMRSDMRDMRTKMRALVQSADYSDDKAKALIAEKSAAMQEMMLMRVSTAHKVWGILTPDQQKKWNDMVSNIQAKRAAKHAAKQQKHSS